MSSTTTPVATRLYRTEDEPDVLDLLHVSLGDGPAGERAAPFFRWKHMDNPFGESLMLLATDGDRVVGLRAFMRWRFLAGDRVVTAVRAVDTATHPEYQGRGIFRKLTLEALDRLRGDVDLVFNTPNEKSLPGYLKMGWRTVGRLPVLVAPRHPIHVLRRWRSGEAPPVRPVKAPTAAEALADPDVPRLLTDRREPRLHTVRTPEYIRWRYADAPLLGYRAVTERDSGGGLVGMAVFRVRPRGGLREATVSELIVGDRGAAVGHRLLRAVARTGQVDHLAMLFPPHSVERSAARRVGGLRVPGGVTLVCNPLHVGIEPDPPDVASWSLTAGDVEVF
jgi:GNAT superfamily N-acetyltransferase